MGNKEMNFELAVKLSRIPVSTRISESLPTFIQRKGTEQGYSEVLKYVSERPPQHPFLTLIGNTGTGKSHLAIGIGWHWLENGFGQVRYWETQDLLDYLQRGYKIGREA